MRRTLITVGAAALTAATATSVASGDQVPPPGPTGCAVPLSDTDTDPEARLPPSSTFRVGPQSVVFALQRPTQATRVELSAFTLGGRRADDFEEGVYACTRPASSIRLAFGVRPGTVGPAIRRHDFTRLRLRVLLVNARGRATVLRRTVTVVRDPRDPRGRKPKLSTVPLLVRSDRGAVLHLSTDRPVRATVRIAGIRTRPRFDTHFDFFVRDRGLRPGRRYGVTMRLESRTGASTVRRERLVLRRRFPGAG